MSFNLTTISVTGSFYDASGTGLNGSVSFTPTSSLTDSSGKFIMSANALTATVSSGIMSAQTLACTDNANVLPTGWQYIIAVTVPGAVTKFNTYISSTLGSSVDIAQLQPSVPVATPTGTYVQSINGLTGQITITVVNGVLTVVNH